ncbi:MAG: ATP-dependent 6-phosphofructokinase, partial [Firmicutes bacterium]|nr:ATP-dependent 6-phosphofructokinase [Bacillota bacterium]
GSIEKVDRTFVANIIAWGGTVIRSARLPEFADIEVRKKGVEQLKKYGIDALVVIGGDGTYMGAKKLTEMGINCIGLPGTIDNDLACTDYTIGFDTALNTIVQCVDKLRDTSSSHQRCSVIEVMGNHCGDLALYSGVACGAELIISPDHQLPKEEVMATLRDLKTHSKRHALVIVSEKLFDVKDLAREIEIETGFESRAEVLGRIQRGGSPTAFDRILAARMGVFAIELLLQGKSGRCVGIVQNHLVDYDIYDALKLERDKHVQLLNVIATLK